MLAIPKSPYDSAEKVEQLTAEITEALCDALLPKYTSGVTPSNLRLCAHFATCFERASEDAVRLLLSSTGHFPSNVTAIEVAQSALIRAAARARQHVEENANPPYFVEVSRRNSPDGRSDLLGVVEKMPLPTRNECLREVIGEALTSLLLLYGLGTADVYCGGGVPENVLAYALGEGSAVSSLMRATSIIIAEKLFWFEEHFALFGAKEAEPAMAQTCGLSVRVSGGEGQRPRGLT